MDERPRSDVSDKYSCQCSNCKCRLSIRNKIKIKVAIAKVAPYAVFVGKRIFISDAAEEAEISLRVAIDIYQWLREVCSYSQTATDSDNLGWSRRGRSDR